MRVIIIIGSTRRGRQTPTVARYLYRRFRERPGVAAEILDLKELTLPFLEERLKYLDDPPPRVRRFGAKVGAADLLVVVSPEYNGSCPGVLKNALDYLNDEYRDKPVAVATVSAGPHGGRKCFEVLHTLFRRVGADPLDDHFQVNNVEKKFDEEGRAVDDEYLVGAQRFIDAALDRATGDTSHS